MRSHFLEGFFGNQPLFTLFSCSNNSFIAHNDEVPVIAKRIEIRPQVNIAPTKNPNPAIKKTGQIFLKSNILLLLQSDEKCQL